MIVGGKAGDWLAFYYIRSVPNPAVVMQCYPRLCPFHNSYHMWLYLKNPGFSIRWIYIFATIPRKISKVSHVTCEVWKPNKWILHAWYNLYVNSAEHSSNWLHGTCSPDVGFNFSYLRLGYFFSFLLFSIATPQLLFSANFTVQILIFVGSKPVLFWISHKFSLSIYYILPF